MKEEETPILLNPDYRDPKGSVYSIIPLKKSLTGVNNPATRIIDRDATFSQSRGRMNIRKIIKQREFTLLYADDLFHTLIDAPTSRTFGILLSCYVFIICIYTIIYYFVSEVFNCNMDITNIIEAYFFSLETMATIGYGTRDIFFGDSWIMAIVLTSQICVKIITDALTIGVIYCRISRPNKRASTIVFSNNAIIKRINNRFYLTFRVGELRKHQLVEAHIRCYTIRHERNCETGDVTPFKCHSMRLNHPNDELGGMLLMCFPQEILHELDAWSPLMPPPTWGSMNGVYHWHPPVLAHAKLTNENHRMSTISSDPTEDSYDPELYSSWPGISRRSASEDPGGLWRKKLVMKDSSKHHDTAATASRSSSPLPHHTSKNCTLKSKKKRISLGITRHVEPGQSRQNYFEMIRTIAETQFAGHSPPPSSHGSGGGGGGGTQSNESNVNSESVFGSDTNDHSTAVSDAEGEDMDCEQSIRPFASPINQDINETVTTSTSTTSASASTTPAPSSTAPGITEKVISPAPPFFLRHPIQKNKDSTFESPSSSYSSPPPPFASPPPQRTKNHDDEKFHEQDWQQIEKNMIQNFLYDRNVEIIVLVEGQDSATGGVVQARHSYKLEDILWNTSFIPCVLQDDLDGTPVIDFGLFHETELTYHDDEEKSEERSEEGDEDDDEDEEGSYRRGHGSGKMRGERRDEFDQKMSSSFPSSESYVRKRYYQAT